MSAETSASPDSAAAPGVMVIALRMSLPNVQPPMASKAIVAPVSRITAVSSCANRDYFTLTMSLPARLLHSARQNTQTRNDFDVEIFVAGHTQIAVQRVIHTIHATYDLHACRLLYQDALGGLVFAENYFPAEDRDCALLYVTNHSIEPMAPRTRDDMSKGFARMTSKIGESFHSFELKVEDGPAASQAIRDAGGVVASDYGFFFFVKPESTGGVLLEVCSSAMPNDPYDRPGGWGPSVGTGHASSVLQLDHIACVTSEIEKAIHFFTSVLDGRVIEDGATALPQDGRRVLLSVGDIQVAFIQPDDTEQGPLGAFLNKPQNGIYALVWRVKDEETARDHFEKRNLRMTKSACISSGFAIDPEDFFGARHEFVC